MRSMGEVMAEQTNQIRQSYSYRIRLALRDINDVHLHPELPDITEQAKPQVQEIIHRHSDMSKKEFMLLQQLSGQVKYLQEKTEELQRKRGVKPKSNRVGYKGLK